MTILFSGSRSVSPSWPLSWVFFAVGSLAMFLIIVARVPASASSALALTINQYISVTKSRDLEFAPTSSYSEESANGSLLAKEGGGLADNLDNPSLGSGNWNISPSVSLGDNQNEVMFQDEIMADEDSKTGTEVEGLAFAPTLYSEDLQEVGTGNRSIPVKNNGQVEDSSQKGPVKNDVQINGDGLASKNPSVPIAPSIISPSANNFEKSTSRRCDLYHGKWVYDPAGPLYRNSTCPQLTQAQNCQGNGRPDKDYENWRWKPSKCELPRFDARKFLELMRGKTLAFVGDSLTRNQMESMICILWQAETPINRGNRRIHKWYFRSTSTTIARVWSAWLVHKTSPANPNSPRKGVKVHLDTPDEDFMEFLPSFDVLVVSSGHWFTPDSVYMINGTSANEQFGNRKKSRRKQVNTIRSYSIALHTTLNAIVSLPNYKGLTILRTYSPSHYEGGNWNSGGSCAGMVSPSSKSIKNGYIRSMLKTQVTEFGRLVKKVRNGSRLQLMDITELSGYRHDGHAGPYRDSGSKAAVKKGRKGPEDCVHWCMPGPIDTWNEILFEIIRREFCSASEDCS